MGHMYTSMSKHLHLLVWEKTPAAGRQRPPVGLRPAADYPEVIQCQYTFKLQHEGLCENS